MSAVESLAVAFIRGRVPEFEAHFRRLLEQEGYWDLGGIQVFAELARWVMRQRDDELVARVFYAVEFMKTEDSMRYGGAEAVEFYETIDAEARDERVMSRLARLWGGPTEAWMTAYGRPRPE